MRYSMHVGCMSCIWQRYGLICDMWGIDRPLYGLLAVFRAFCGSVRECAVSGQKDVVSSRSVTLLPPSWRRGEDEMWNLRVTPLVLFSCCHGEWPVGSVKPSQSELCSLLGYLISLLVYSDMKTWFAKEDQELTDQLKLFCPFSGVPWLWKDLKCERRN